MLSSSGLALAHQLLRLGRIIPEVGILSFGIQVVEPLD